MDKLTYEEMFELKKFFKKVSVLIILLVVYWISFELSIVTALFFLILELKKIGEILKVK